MNPTQLSEFLGLQFSSSFSAGEYTGENKSHHATTNAWFLSSKDQISSKDCRRHIDYLTELLIPITGKLNALIKDHAEIDITCHWVSKNGHGGPTLSPKQLDDLSKIGVDFWFDLY